MTHFDKDSLLHLGINGALALVLGLFGVCAGLGASVAKEWADLKFYGHWCWADFVSDVIGMAVGFYLHAVILKLFIL